ncbi:hypothetical protein NX059_010986 [Plenodomus lindquistii]|nr:hypothetical protein NX059_010986 [Plenodomus lindquistii]
MFIPTCVNVTFSDDDDSDDSSFYKTFCAYTNSGYNGGRGISFVVPPEVAATFTNEAFGVAIGGLEDQMGEEMGMWEIKETAEKGRGLFAKKNVAAVFAGETLIKQTPVLLVSKELLASDMETEKETVVTKAIEQLPSATRKVVETLDASTGTFWHHVVKNNGLTVKWPWVDEVPRLVAVVPEVARINHDCRPNTLWRFDDYTMSIEIVALKEIKPGEEITLSYGYETRPAGRRMKSIRANLGFTCKCPLCSADYPTIEASNDRLSEIKALKSVLPQDEKDSAELLRLLPSLISQLQEEDLHTDVPKYEEILAYTWSSFGFEDKAKYWAGRARKHWAIIAGKDSWEQRRCGELEDNVTGHSTWKTWKGEPWEDVSKEETVEKEGNDSGEQKYVHRHN